MKRSGYTATCRLLLGILVIFLICSVPVSGSEPTDEYSYSLVHISDTQVLSAKYPGTLNFTFSYLESVKNDYNISGIVITGDLVDSGVNTTQWENYANARSLTSIPLYEVSGNHDISGSANNYTAFDTYIGVGKRKWTANINDFLFIGIGYTRSELSEPDVEKYSDLIKSDQSKIPLFATHNYFDGVSYSSPLSPLGAGIKSDLIIRDPTFIMCGHMHGNILHSGLQNGNTLVEDMTNYQASGNVSAGKLYTVYKSSTDVTRITARDFYIAPVQSSGPEIIVYQKAPVIVSGTKIGVFRNGFWILDRNGNFLWDGRANGDEVAGFGMSGDRPVIGNWNHAIPGDKIGVFRNGTWLLDYNGDFLWGSGDVTASIGKHGDIPIVGDWNSNGDKKIGLYRDGFWILDKNGNFNWDGTGTDADEVAGFGQAGDVPVVADWNGTGQDKIGVFRNGFWILDYNGNFHWDGKTTDRVTGFGAAGDVPLVRDWNGNGLPEIAVFRPVTGEWLIDMNGNFMWDGTSPGGDIRVAIGHNGDVPMCGDWGTTGTDRIGVFRNGFWILDYNGNFIWEGSPADKVAGFGTTGDIPVVGKFV